jgi:hypothetical protein
MTDEAKGTKGDRLQATCVLLSARDLDTLRVLALERSRLKRTRVSQSGVLRDLIGYARKRLDEQRAASRA